MTRLKIVLEKSIAKHGNKPLTLQHLVNIIKMIQKEEIEEQEKFDEAFNRENIQNQS